MSSSAADTLVVDPAQALASATLGDEECITELIIRRQMPTTSSFCINPQLQTHPYDRPPPRPPRVNRHPTLQNPVMASLMNTVAEARSRKRQREEGVYVRRHIGQQTDPAEGEEAREEPNLYERENGISSTRRQHRDACDDEPRHNVTKESVGTNTTPPPPPTPAAQTTSEPSSSEPSSSGSPSDQPSSSGSPTSLSNLTAATQQVLRAAQRRRERDMRPSRRERRERIHQQETQRLLLENHVQQIDGVMPGHSCNMRCPHYQQILHNAMSPFDTGPPPTGPNAVSPTLAPGAFMRGGHPLATATNFPIHYPIPTYAHTVQVPVLAYYHYSTVAVPPVPTAPVVGATPTHTIHAPVPIRPPPTLFGLSREAIQGTTLGYLDMLRNTSYGYLLPSFERYGLDRHHMFAGLDIDVPIGASKTIIDKCTLESQYAKKEGEEEEDACTVCLSNFEEGESIRKLPCNHEFHPECIYKWLDINKKCPMCREDIDKARNGQPEQQQQEQSTAQPAQ